MDRECRGDDCRKGAGQGDVRELRRVSWRWPGGYRQGQGRGLRPIESHDVLPDHGRLWGPRSVPLFRARTLRD